MAVNQSYHQIFTLTVLESFPTFVKNIQLQWNPDLDPI